MHSLLSYFLFFPPTPTSEIYTLSLHDELPRAWLLGRAGKFVGAFTLGAGVDDPTHYFLIIGTGAWLGTIMLFNVWVLIWPNQKKILGVVAATDEEKARARKVAGMASRVNFVLSIPMLMCMAAASHGLPFIH